MPTPPCPFPPPNKIDPHAPAETPAPAWPAEGPDRGGPECTPIPPDSDKPYEAPPEQEPPD